jgi:hypothetical protein
LKLKVIKSHDKTARKLPEMTMKRPEIAMTSKKTSGSHSKAA